MLLAFLQEHGATGHAVEGAKAAEHGAAAGEAAGHAAEGHHTPWLVEQVNHLFGHAAYSIESAIMPAIYQIPGMKLLFGAEHWPGEGMSYGFKKLKRFLKY